MELFNESPEIFHRSIDRIDGGEIGDVASEIGEGRGEETTEDEAVDAQVEEVVQVLAQACLEWEEDVYWYWPNTRRGSIFANRCYSHNRNISFI